MNRPLFPFTANIKDILDFKSEEGQIKLGDERFLLFSQNAVSLLRTLLQSQLGPELSRMLLAQFGYQQGCVDYKTLQNMFSWESDEKRLAAGPLMHAWSGIVQVEPLDLEIDRGKGHFYFRGFWHHSYEAEIHRMKNGKSHAPVCYSLAGYGSGWCSAFFGKPMLEIERRCLAMGDDICEWEIKPWDDWGPEAEPWKKSLISTSASIYQELATSNRKIHELNQNLEKEVLNRTAENRRLLRMICHDLVVPIQAMKKALGSLTSPESTSEKEHVYLTIGTCIDAMQSMLSHVREAEAYSSGKVPLEPQAFSVNEALSTMEVMFQASMKSKHIRLKIDNRLGDTDFLWVHPVTFTSHILSNIVGNAVKFSPRDGTIFLTIDCEGEFIKMSVRDEGIGIPPRLRPHLFSEHIPTSRIGTDGEKGTGFGLPLVKSYVEHSGGTIQIDSISREENPFFHGTTVTICLPRAGGS